ncbi:hypothetical protein [Microvirga massiliensis]|uniref:hypothetical protein n=1 Tax=Microvirga massiliensis TaxID=1033741 RepID=UPI00062B5FDB|nr:hypothetical protein [Microvirga massiliensis]
MVHADQRLIRSRDPRTAYVRPTRIACLAVFLALPGSLAFSSVGPSAKFEPDRAPFPSSVAGLTAQSDPSAHERSVRGRLAAGLCISLRLPENWTLSTDRGRAHLLDAKSGAEFEIDARSTVEPRDSQEADLSGREAAALQKQYEEIIGKPAQAVLHEPTNYVGVSHWSATWIDANFAAESHSHVIETFIVVDHKSVVDVTLVNVGAREAYDRHVSRMLSSLRIETEEDCRPDPLAER